MSNTPQTRDERVGRGVIGFGPTTGDLVAVSLVSGGHVLGALSDIGHNRGAISCLTVGSRIIPWVNVRYVKVVMHYWNRPPRGTP